MSVLNKPLITDKEIRDFLGVSQPTLWRMTKERNFPAALIKGHRPGRKVREWLESNGVI